MWSFVASFASGLLRRAFVLENVCFRSPWQTLDTLHSLELIKRPWTQTVSSARVSGREGNLRGWQEDSQISTFKNTWDKQHFCHLEEIVAGQSENKDS